MTRGETKVAQISAVHNPFLLLLNPEVVLAAIEKSEHLGRLNRHLCRPLDRQTPAGGVSVDDLDSGSEAIDPVDEPVVAN